MSGFYNRMQKTATRLLTKYGTPVSITRNGASVASAMAVFVQNDKDILDTLPDSASTTADLKTCIVTGNFPAEPTVGDTLVQGDKSWRIMLVKQSRPATTTTHYTLVLQ